MGSAGILRRLLLLAALSACPAIALAATTPSIVDLSTEPTEAVQPRPPAVPSPRQPTQGQVKPSPSANPLWGVPIKQLSNTRERPIFSPSRRPPPPVVVAAPPPPPPPAQIAKEPERPQLTLLGTIINDSDGYGIFMDQLTKAPVRIRIGGSHQGWTLRSLHAGAATLEKGPHQTVLEFVKRIGQPNGFNRVPPPTNANLPPQAPGSGLTTGQLPPSNPPPQPVNFPQGGPPFGSRPPPPNAAPR